MEQLKGYYQQWCDVPQPRKIKAIKLIAFVCFSLFLLLLVIYAFGRTGKKTVTIVPTILFTDGTPYNMELVRYLAQRRDVVIGMIVLNSNTLAVGKLRSSAGNVEDMLTALKAEGYTRTVPVYVAPASPSADTFAPQLQQMMASQSVTFVIAGAATEAAYFLQTFPTLRARVTNIFIAGGAFNTAGNANYFAITNTKAERNFFLDAAAADYVVAASHGRPVTVFPMDTTMKWTAGAYATIVSNPGSSAASVTAVSQGLGWYYADVDGTQRTTVGIMAAAYASDAQVRASAQFTSIPVRVTTTPASVELGRSFRPASGTAVQVVLSVSADLFFSHLLVVNSLPLV
ncbi:Inosine-uridine preferring nucleoside hydrolase [Novymonas esmeraldas]|uniref:Inosine-uridine preferring nucleoside hydrolase n=1 Tax=Novymonas esmeraldas TaxID=1808958 RepID=A0AAW0F3N6_9TRYP